MAVESRKKRPFVLPGLVAGAVLGIWALATFRGEPGERSLVRRFEENQAAFNELKAMVLTNSPGEPLRQDGNVWSLEHYRRYRALLRQTGVIRTVKKGNDLRFLIFEPEPRKQGSRIAVTWVVPKPDRVLSRLEDFRKAGNQDEQAYLPLAKNWYLWIQK